MKSDDAAMLREIQKNSDLTLKAITSLSQYVQDTNLEKMLHGQSRILENIRNRAVDFLLDGGEEVRRESVLDRAMVVGAVYLNTAFNTSTSRLAQIVIRNHQRGVTEIWKAINRHDAAGGQSVELAEELAAFEESCVETMRRYL